MQRVWNAHRIRTTKNANLVGGKPLLLYSIPHMYGADDYLTEISLAQIQACKQECLQRGTLPCHKSVFGACCHLMAVNGWESKEDGDQATQLYLSLRQEILNGLENNGYP